MNKEKELIKKIDKIYVAGHNGMVGKALVNKLKSENYKNLLTVDRNKLDLTDINAVKNWFKKNKPEIVILAAAKVGGIYANNTYPSSFLLDNLKIQNNVIESAWKNNVRRFLFLGSSCIYPKLSNQPIKEEYLMDGGLEKTNQWYALAKISGIYLCNALRLEFGFDSISLMPTNLYGPGDNYHPQQSHVLPSLIRRFSEAKENDLRSVTCWGTGKPLREFLHVEDLASACIHALKYWNPSFENAPRDDKGNILFHLNVGTGKDISIRDIAQIISRIINYKGEIKWDESKPDGTMRKRLDVSRINSLGWKSSIDIKDGINSTIKNYLFEKSERLIRE